MINTHPLVSIFSVRFLYGMRLVGPLVIGASRVSPVKFICINLLGALVWATLFAGIGYGAGEFLERILGDLKAYRLPIAAGVVGLMVVFAVVRHWRVKK